MLDTTILFKTYINQFKNCFYKDKYLVLRIIIFIITGMSVLCFLFALASLIFLVTLFQIPAVELNKFLKDENLSPAVRVTRMILACPIAYLCYVAVPILYMVLWIIQFLYNCFAYATSLGKSGWVDLMLK